MDGFIPNDFHKYIFSYLWIEFCLITTCLLIECTYEYFNFKHYSNPISIFLSRQSFHLFCQKSLVLHGLFHSYFVVKEISCSSIILSYQMVNTLHFYLFNLLKPYKNRNFSPLITSNLLKALQICLLHYHFVCTPYLGKMGLVFIFGGKVKKHCGEKLFLNTSKKLNLLLLLVKYKLVKKIKQEEPSYLLNSVHDFCLLWIRKM